MKVVRNRVIVAFERAIHVWCGLTGSHLLSEYVVVWSSRRSQKNLSLEYYEYLTQVQTQI